MGLRVSIHFWHKSPKWPFLSQKSLKIRSKTTPKPTPKWCQNDAKMIRKWPQNDHGSAQKWSKITQKETHFVPFWTHFIWHLQCFAAENVLSVGEKTSCRLQLSAPFQPSIYRIASAAVHHVQGLVTQIPESAEDFFWNSPKLVPRTHSLVKSLQLHLRSLPAMLIRMPCAASEHKRQAFSTSQGKAHCAGANAPICMC